MVSHVCWARKACLISRLKKVWRAALNAWCMSQPVARRMWRSQRDRVAKTREVEVLVRPFNRSEDEQACFFSSRRSSALKKRDEGRNH